MEPTSDLKRLRDIIRHIKNVQANTELLAFRLAEKGDVDLARHLLAVGFTHDNSKLFGVEWDYLHRDTPEELRVIAQANHVEHNQHHPEYWQSIEDMPDVHVAELVCDLKARSAEMGNDVREYIEEVFMPRYNIKPKSKTDKRLKKYLAILLDETFK